MIFYPSDYNLCGPFVDLTLLDPAATLNDFYELCKTARANKAIVRGVCVPCSKAVIQLCAGNLKHGGQKTVAVNDFPDGNGEPEIKWQEAWIAKEAGADEIDTVINARHLREGEYGKTLPELMRLSELYPASLKVILETGYSWYTEKLIKKATELSVTSGAFCVKTSTGRNAIIPVEAKVRHVKWMYEVIQAMKSPTLIKIAGGIKTMAHAKLFWDVVPPERLIFGASAKFWEMEK